MEEQARKKAENGGAAASTKKQAQGVQAPEDSSPFRSSRECETLMPIDRTKSRQLRSHVHVSVRLKPATTQPLERGQGSLLPHPPNHGSTERKRLWSVINQQSLRLTTSGHDDDIFTFDRAYDETMSTRAIFQDQCLHLIEQAIQGYNATILAYG